MSRDEMICTEREPLPYGTRADADADAVVDDAITAAFATIPRKRRFRYVMFIGLGCWAVALLWGVAFLILFMVLEGITYDPSGYVVLAGMMVASGFALKSAECGALLLLFAAVLRIVEWYKERKERLGQEWCE
ncbi:hypothetical protein [Bifidobacterium sp. SO4]|uniref:hypothetical protein n=1 Tax=Bifidobacterium sp. SO4 TaxID=2809030 RepID=UPI001BDBF55C|nr:hypothetical protein [Bifidobacterium sp. SO4]MBT1170705.1 hypothetical protein [Bifidobacterium sp. SO4]